LVRVAAPHWVARPTTSILCSTIAFPEASAYAGGKVIRSLNLVATGNLFHTLPKIRYKTARMARNVVAAEAISLSFPLE
jgi:hypothetical protein